MSGSSRVDSILDLIGQTPVLRLRRAWDPRGAHIFAKLESMNPGGSVKDRIALAMLRQAEAEGRIQAGRSTIIEATSGNTGVGLAMACAALGYRLILTMPDDLSIERRRLLEAYGAECVLTPAADAMRGAIDASLRIGERVEDAFYPSQFANPANPGAHRAGTGPELVTAFAEDGLHGFVCGVGTGGTVSGVAPVLRAAFPDIQIWVVEPEGSAVLTGGAPGLHGIQGIGAGFVPPVLDRAAYDAVVALPDAHAIEGSRALARAEGLLVGISSGAAFVVARQLARKLGPGRNVAFLCASTGERYLSTGLFG